MAMCTSRGVTTGEGLQVSMQIPSFQNQGGSRGQSPSPQDSQDLRVSSQEMQHPLMSALTTPLREIPYGPGSPVMKTEMSMSYGMMTGTRPVFMRYTSDHFM